MKKLLALLMLLLCSALSQAATYYVRACDAGAQSGCAVGSGNGSSDALAYPSYTSLPSLNAGDIVRFQRGGANNVSTGWIIQGGTSRSNPIVVEDYTSSVSTGGTNKPRFNATTASNNRGLIVWIGSGYTLRNLWVVGNGGTNGVGVFLYSNNDLQVQGITLDGVDVDNAGVGVHCAASSASARPRFVTITGARIQNNLGVAGVLADCDDFTLATSDVSFNGSNPTFDHNLYINNNSTLSNGSRGYTVVFSTFKDSAVSGGVCTGTSIEIEGIKTGIYFYGNSVTNTAGVPAGQGCWGIEVVNGYDPSRGPECFKQIRIDSNIIADMGNTGINISACQDCEVVNNKIMWTFATGYSINAISVASAASHGIDCGDSDSKIRNNAIYFATSGSNTATGVATEGGGANDTILASNIIYFGAGTGSRCLNLNSAPSGHFLAIGNNLCYRAAGSGSYTETYSTLAAAQAAGIGSGDQTCSPQLVTPPTLGNGYSLQWGAAGCQKDTGNTTYSHRFAYRGRPIIGAPDIGPEDQ